MQFYDDMLDKNIPDRGLPCQLEGILESACTPLDSVRDQLEFCGPYIYDHICIPVYLVSSFVIPALIQDDVPLISKCGKLGL